MIARLQHLAFVLAIYRITRSAVLVIGLVALWLVLTAASAPSETTALAICGVAGVALSFVLKLVPANGFWILGITLAASFAIAVGAELYTGELVLSELQHADASTLVKDFMSAWGLSQLTYAALTQSPKTVGAVT